VYIRMYTTVHHPVAGAAGRPLLAVIFGDGAWRM
jgi:hypothetical protein